MKTKKENIGLKEVLRLWDNNNIIWTIERGGMGPGYEQAIQIGVFELCKDLIGKKVPTEKIDNWFDEALHKTIKREKRLSGLSGAQAGAIKNLAYRFLTKGYSETIDSAKEAKIKLIMVTNKFI